MYKRKIEELYEENPQKEVLQQCIRLQKGLIVLFKELQQLYITLQI